MQVYWHISSYMSAVHPGLETYNQPFYKYAFATIICQYYYYCETCSTICEINHVLATPIVNSLYGIIFQYNSVFPCNPLPLHIID